MLVKGPVLNCGQHTPARCSAWSLYFILHIWRVMDSSQAMGQLSSTNTRIMSIQTHLVRSLREQSFQQACYAQQLDPSKACRTLFAGSPILAIFTWAVAMGLKRTNLLETVLNDVALRAHVVAAHDPSLVIEIGEDNEETFVLLTCTEVQVMLRPRIPKESLPRTFSTGTLTLSNVMYAVPAVEE
jgi:hypothetical protein